MESATDQTTDRRDDALIDVTEYGTAGRAAWLDIDWRQHLHQHRIGGRAVNFAQYGDPAAPPLVLIHGLAGCWQNWLENIPALAADFNVIAVDLPGFGESESPPEEISLPGYAQTVIGLLDLLGIERAAIIGNSMGGQTAAQTAIDFPDRTGRLILVSPAGYSTCDAPPILAHGIVTAGMILARVAPRRKLLVTRPRLRQIALGGVVAHPDQLSPEMSYEMIGADEKVGFVVAAQAILAHDCRERLADIESPTLIVWGRNDRLVTSRDAERFERRIPGSRKLVLRDTGHCAMVERPEWFNRTAREFLLAG
ncbi:MAG: alpha/beta fold hydrolase [Thermoleophilia bacterium]|nr:alpha/beta fold hydrolase [Thermoleophilia bacterium]